MGARVIGRYELEERIGAGAMGVVWRARCLDDGATVAVKVLREDLTRDPEMVKRFGREGQALLKARGRHVANLREVVAEGDVAALVTDHLPAGDLRAWLTRHGPRPPAEAAALVAQVFDGLATVHGAGIVHRDVKPENVLLRSGSDGGPVELVLSDFGIARLMDLSTITHGVLGTPYYLAPEVTRGGTVTPAADMYAAGIVLYELLAGRPPFRGEHLMAVVFAHAEQPPPPLAGCAAPLWRLLEQLLAKDPGGRPRSAAEVRDRLLALVPGLPTTVDDGPRLTLLTGLAGGLDSVLRRRLADGGPTVADPAGPRRTLLTSLAGGLDSVVRRQIVAGGPTVVDPTERLPPTPPTERYEAPPTTPPAPPPTCGTGGSASATRRWWSASRSTDPRRDGAAGAAVLSGPMGATWAC